MSSEATDRELAAAYDKINRDAARLGVYVQRTGEAIGRALEAGRPIDALLRQLAEYSAQLQDLPSAVPERLRLPGSVEGEVTGALEETEPTTEAK